MLDYIYDAYLEYLGLSKIPRNKRIKILTDEEYRKKYHVFKLPEKEFIKLYINCHEKTSRDAMYNNIKKIESNMYGSDFSSNFRIYFN